jgi:hypothetical protein
MAKEKEDIVGIIPQNERREDLEVQVRYHVARIGDQPKTYKRYSPNKHLTFKDPREQQEYHFEEIRRCIEGYDGLCGKMYGFLNYGILRDPEKGRIRPTYKSIQHTWYKKIESLQETPGRGIVCIKRRRIGASWMEAWDAVHDCSFKPFYQIGMNSKSETDSRKLFQHIKFMHQNMPDWIRANASTSDRRDFMEFAYWYDTSKQKIVASKGVNTRKEGNQSWISSVAPTDNAHEGEAYSKLIIDEAGKIENLMTIWSFAEDCLMIPPRRVGIPIIFGTVGDIDKNGKGLMEMWKNHDSYDLDQFGFWGYNGLIIDEYGNDMIEDAVRWIIYEREKKKGATKKVRDAFLQKYPLEERDAFNQVTNGGIGDPELIADQLHNLLDNPPLKRTGWMRRSADGGVSFVPNNEGKIIIYDLPDHNRKDGYVSVCDPAEDDDVEKSRDTSDLAAAILAKPFGLDPAKIVAEYADRPKKIDDYFEQYAMLLEWYNKLQFLPELNKGGWRMLKYFEERYPHLLGLAPASASSAKGGVEMRRGVKMTAERKQQMIGLIEDHIDNYSKFIPSVKFLEQCKVFGDDHADDDFAIAVGWCLICMQADKRAAKRTDENLSKVAKSQLKIVNGVLTRVNPGRPVTGKPGYGPNSSIFSR